MTETSKPAFTRETTIEDLWNDPAKYGLPTFEQFAENPEILRAKATQVLADADAGSTQLNRLVKKHYYFIDGYRCNSIEEVERIALNQGYDLSKLQMKPELEKDTAGKLVVKIAFVNQVA